jgi:hypothetical protein
VGSPEEVAEELVAWVDETDVDGFNLAYAVTPESFADFVDLVVPELQKRGHYEMEYAPGTVRSTTIASPASYSRPCWPGKRQPIKPLGFRLPSPDFSPVDAACMCRSAPVSAWKWDHEFESAFLQQRVTRELAAASGSASPSMVFGMVCGASSLSRGRRDRRRSPRISPRTSDLAWKTIADICLVTQVTPAKTFDLPLDPYPHVIRVYDNCMAIPVREKHHRRCRLVSTR